MIPCNPAFFRTEFLSPPFFIRRKQSAAIRADIHILILTDNFFPQGFCPLFLSVMRRNKKTSSWKISKSTRNSRDFSRKCHIFFFMFRHVSSGHERRQEAEKIPEIKDFPAFPPSNLSVSNCVELTVLTPGGPQSANGPERGAAGLQRGTP